MSDRSAATEDEELDRLAAQVEAAWEADPNADIQSVRDLRPPRARWVHKDTLSYWLTGIPMVVLLALSPLMIFTEGAMLLPLLLLVLSLLIFASAVFFRGKRDRRWLAFGVGAAGLLLMAGYPVMTGLNEALKRPDAQPPFWQLVSFLREGAALGWVLGIIGLYAAWLIANRRPPLAYLSLAVLGAALLLGVLILSNVTGYVDSSLSPSYGRPIVDAYPGWNVLEWANPPVIFMFVLCRAFEIGAVWFSARMATLFVERAERAGRLRTAQNEALERAIADGSIQPRQRRVEVFSAPRDSDRINTLAILSLVFGIAGGGVLPVVLGHIARSQISRTGERGAGFALAGLILGYIGFGVSMAVLIGYVIFQVWLSATFPS